MLLDRNLHNLIDDNIEHFSLPDIVVQLNSLMNVPNSSIEQISQLTVNRIPLSMKFSLKLFFICILATLFRPLAFAEQRFEDMANKMADSFKAPRISAEKLQSLMNKKNIIILDTREKKEFNVSHIKNAIYVGYDNFDLDDILQKIKKDSIVVAYCSVGYRSGKITQRLKEKGIDAYNLYGGLFNWNNTDKPLYSDTETKTNAIHGYDKQWGKWLTKGDVVY